MQLADYVRPSYLDGRVLFLSRNAWIFALLNLLFAFKLAIVRDAAVTIAGIDLSISQSIVSLSIAIVGLYTLLMLPLTYWTVWAVQSPQRAHFERRLASGEDSTGASFEEVRQPFTAGKVGAFFQVLLPSAVLFASIVVSALNHFSIWASALP
jgi:hypothetical protein